MPGSIRFHYKNLLETLGLGNNLALHPTPFAAGSDCASNILKTWKYPVMGIIVSMSTLPVDFLILAIYAEYGKLKTLRKSKKTQYFKIAES
jgi:hypothetical protein